MKNFEAMILFKTEHYDLFSKLRDNTKWSDDNIWQWFNTENEPLGQVKPIDMINSGRLEELNKFIESCIKRIDLFNELIAESQKRLHLK